MRNPKYQTFTGRNRSSLNVGFISGFIHHVIGNRFLYGASVFVLASFALMADKAFPKVRWSRWLVLVAHGFTSSTE